MPLQCKNPHFNTKKITKQLKFKHDQRNIFKKIWKLKLKMVVGFVEILSEAGRAELIYC